MSIHLRCLGSKTHTRGAGAVEDNKLAFEEDITKKGWANPFVGLEATKAFWAGRRVVEVVTGDDSAVGADTKGKIGESDWAGECVPSLGGIAKVQVLALLSAEIGKKMTC
jgi:hypothetical protein